MDTRNRRYLLRLLGHKDAQPELQVIKNTEELNQIFDHTPIFCHRLNDRPEFSEEADRNVLVGIILPNETERASNPTDGKAIYTTAEIIGTQIQIFETFMEYPAGIDITSEPLEESPYVLVISIDLVHNPRGSGRIVREKT